MRMAMPNATRPKVLEFSRWAQSNGDQNYNDPNPEDLPEDLIGLIDRQDLLFPQLLDEDPTRKVDTAFWVDSQKGSCYIRGNLTVGSNARIWTGAGLGQADWFVQMDQEFPIMILPRSIVGAPNIPSLEGDSVNYTPAARDEVKRTALFWASRGGEAGFNTGSTAIFIDDDPLAPPSGTTDIKVISRLFDGLGRVHVSASFTIMSNREQPDWLQGCSHALYLAAGGNEYWNDSATYTADRPSERFSDPRFGAPTDPDTNNATVILRAKSGSGSTDVGEQALRSWEQQHANTLYKITEYYQKSDPSHRNIQGSIEVPASSNYKVILVVAERWPRNEDQGPMAGAIESSGQQRSAINVVNGTFLSQQVMKDA